MSHNASIYKLFFAKNLKLTAELITFLHHFILFSSGALKEEYERLKSEMLKAEEETNFTYLKKRGVVAERKEAKIEKEEAEKYQRLKDELVKVEIKNFVLRFNF